MNSHHLGYVPPILADETIYSCLAAHCRLVPDGNLTKRILGARRTCSRTDWPVGLNSISRALPPNLEATAPQLLMNHTLATAFLPFLEESRRTALLASMYRVDAGEPTKIAGGRCGPIQLPSWLRICLKCSQRDLAAHGRVYLHRIHQLPGVIVCSEHAGSILHDSKIPRRETYTRLAYLDAGRAGIRGPAITFSLDSQEVAIANGISQAYRRLLDGDGKVAGPEHVRLALKAKLLEKGYVFSEGKIDIRSFQEAFLLWFPPRLSMAIGVRLPHGHDSVSWINRCLTRRTPVFNPLLAILVALFLGENIIDLLGKNSALSTVPRHPRRTPGISKAYARFEASKGILRRLWRQKTLSLAEVARRLRVSGLTIRRWAVAIDLPFPRPGPKVILAPVRRARRADIRQLIKANRLCWLRNVKAGIRGQSRNPKSRKLYEWLSRYDPGWLRRNLGKKLSAVLIDWESRDRLVAREVEPAVRMLAARIPFVRLSKTRIAHALGCAQWLLVYPKHFPRTIAVIRRFEETRAAFAARSGRIEVAANEIKLV